MKEFRVDLHLHTCLSPCGSLEMSPQRIVETALERGLDAIAVTDHNSFLQMTGPVPLFRCIWMTICRLSRTTLNDSATRSG